MFVECPQWSVKNALDIRCNSNCHRQYGWAVTINVRTASRLSRYAWDLCTESFGHKTGPTEHAHRRCTRLVAKTHLRVPSGETARYGRAKDSREDTAPAASSPAQPKSIAAGRRPNSLLLLGEIGGCLGHRAARGFQSYSGVPTGRPQSNFPAIVSGPWRGENLAGGSANFGQVVQPGSLRQSGGRGS